MYRSIFVYTNQHAGGSNDKEVTDVAVIACLSPFSLAEIILTVEVTPRIALI